MRTRDAMRILFPRKRRWQPTARWRAAMLENLSRAPRRRPAEKTWQIKQAVRDWLATPPEQRPTQADLARSLGVWKQYINRLVRKLPPSDLAEQPTPNVIPCTPSVPDVAVPPTPLVGEAAPSVIPAHIAAREALLRSTAPPRSEPSQPGIPLSAIYQASVGLRPDQRVLLRGCPVVDQLP